MGKFGKGKLIAGYDRQSKERTNYYRRFNMHPTTIRTHRYRPSRFSTPTISTVP